MDKEGSAVAADMEDPLYLLVLYVDRGGSSTDSLRYRVTRQVGLMRYSVVGEVQ